MSDTFPASMSVALGQLEEQVTCLLARGYSASTFTEAIRGEAGDPTLVVTFDDGYKSVLEAGLPILSALGVPATVFVPTSLVGNGGAPMAWPGIDRWLGTTHERELLPMGWDELGALREAGWEIGSHTTTHPRLTHLDASRRAEELVESRRTLERELDAPCTSIAYPFGDVDREVADAAKGAGYLAGAGLAAHQLRPDPMRWPRVGLYREDSLSRFKFKTSKLARRASLARVRHPFAEA